MKKYFPALQYANVPNTITTVGLIFGIAACYFLVAGNLQKTLLCLFFSASMDLVDGFFAEKLKQQTQFGQQVDSLVDFFICCIMPIGLVFAFVGKYPILVVPLAFYVVCGLWRLAYYNITESKGYFVGLPVPAAMLLVTISIWLVTAYQLPIWIITVVLFLAGLLMVSCVKLQKYGRWQKVLWVVVLFFLAVVVTS
ncbi:MAG: CDP-alcohol phosphatidyltransferase family protein [Defluviitaleaceae bacterium]|nr:CDP-alcohol phosphatidyltransferase family protein [Defluviitaleaceae bacterium]